MGGDTDRLGTLPEGMYDAVVTRSLIERLTAEHLARTIEPLDDADQPSVLARHVAQAVERALDARRSEDKRVALVNRVLEVAQAEDDELPETAQRLVSYLSIPGPGRPVRYSGRPVTPLAESALLTNAREEPSLGSEIRGELASADGVDLLLAFVKWTGLRVLEKELSALRERGVRLRVLTTTYIGATERQALDRLVNDFGAEVKVNYETKRTRLHAKAWIFHRDTGFDTAFIGSSNLSTSALLEGLEWNVRIARHSTPELMRKADATFETYWNDRAFESYDPERDAARLDQALRVASGRELPVGLTVTLSGLEVRPYPFQEEMLEALEVERVVHNRHRNLIVAATGTGKTVVAALDYRNLCATWGGPIRPSLLFVAHRREILEQSLRTYREVLADPNFGELFVGGERPTGWQHVFASIQSLNNSFVSRLAADSFDLVVIDEFHHAEAASYKRLLAKVHPKELLGLTATPERGDGLDVRAMFGNRTAVELRLWDALEAELLSPFHYFGIADNEDLSRIEWKRGGYDVAQLNAVYTGNDARLRIVLKELQDKVSDVHAMRALGFCVSVQHADWMAASFRERGIPAKSATGQTPEDERRAALQELAAGSLKILFTVDLLNEGVDLPDVDTVLFLRPTESATVFLQQLGRGLRRTKDKAVLTALDFVGHQNKEFRFDRRFRALTGASRTSLTKQVEKGFSFLPSGSQIVLDEQTQKSVLVNLNAQITSRWSGIVSELRSLGDVSLQRYLDETGIELADVVGSSTRSWTKARRDAGLATASGGPIEDALLRRVAAFAHVDDPERAEAYLRLLSEQAPGYGNLPERDQHHARMLLYSLFPRKNDMPSYEEAFDDLRREGAARAEIAQIVALGLEGAKHRTRPLTGRLASTSLRVHARYSREEIVAALGYATLERPPSSMMQGVFHAKDRDTDVFLVTLRKSEADYSPTTMYRDYAISPDLFHWESQSQTSVNSPTGQRYVRQGERGNEILIFIRETKVWEFGKGVPYTLLGPADYVSHRGEKPIEIVWRLRHAMPADMFHVARAAAS
ncbi:MAG: DUF3427 domain-containing protein [Actinomycetota bacterium]